MEKAPHQKFIETLPLKDCRQIYKDYLHMEETGWTDDDSVLRQRADEYVQLMAGGGRAEALTLQVFALKVFQRFAGMVLGAPSLRDEDSGRYPYTLSADAVRAAGLAESRSEASNVTSSMAEAQGVSHAEMSRRIADEALMHGALVDAGSALEMEQGERLRKQFTELLPQPPK